MARKRRSFSAAFLSKVALESIQGLRTISEIAQRHKVHPTQIALWKRQLLEGVESIFEKGTSKSGSAQFVIWRDIQAGPFVYVMS